MNATQSPFIIHAAGRRLRPVHSRFEKYSFPMIFRLADYRIGSIQIPVIAIYMADALRLSSSEGGGLHSIFSDRGFAADRSL
jgi:hypothetical protein